MSKATAMFLSAAVLLLCCTANAQLVEASRSGDVDAVRALLEEGAEINSREGLDTPLTAAVRGGHTELVRMLVSRGAEPALPYASRKPVTGNPSRGRRIYHEHRGYRRLLSLRFPKRLPLPSSNDTMYEDLVQNYRERFGLTEEQAADFITWAMRRTDPLVGRTPVEIAVYSCRDSTFALLTEHEVTVHAAARAARRSRILREISSQLCHLQSLHGSADDEVTPLVASSRQAIWYLFDSWPAAFDGAAIYLQELEAIGVALQSAARMDETDGVLAVLRDVASDLEVKLADCYRHEAARIAPIAVHTIRQGEMSRGWQLFYVSRFMSHFPGTEPRPFPGLSSPARHSLPPGRYVVTAKLPGSGRTSEPQTITIGGDSGQEVWEIPVP